MADACTAFDRIYADPGESKNVWAALASLEEEKSADQQVAALWQGLRPRKSPALLKVAIERKLKSTGKAVTSSLTLGLDIQ